MALACLSMLAAGMAACSADFPGDPDGVEVAASRLGPGARAGALTAACGNGVVDAGEQCDDGNLADHDGCSTTCAIELVTQFSFTGAAGPETTFAAELADPGLATSPVMSRGAGLTPALAAGAFSASGWTTGSAVDANDFYRFTVTPVAGCAMNLRALQLEERRSATGIRSWSVRSSLDGFASDIALFSVPDDTLARTTTAQLPAAFHHLTTAVEFRVFGFQAEASAGTWRIDNVTLIGGVAANAPVYVKASNTEGQDQFGFSVALSADGSTRRSAWWATPARRPGSTATRPTTP